MGIRGYCVGKADIASDIYMYIHVQLHGASVPFELISITIFLFKVKHLI